MFFGRTGSSSPCSLFILKNKGVVRGKKKKKKLNTVALLWLSLRNSACVWPPVSRSGISYRFWWGVCVCVCAPTLFHCAVCQLKRKDWFQLTGHSPFCYYLIVLCQWEQYMTSTSPCSRNVNSLSLSLSHPSVCHPFTTPLSLSFSRGLSVSLSVFFLAVICFEITYIWSELTLVTIRFFFFYYDLISLWCIKLGGDWYVFFRDYTGTDY